MKPSLVISFKAPQNISRAFAEQFTILGDDNDAMTSSQAIELANKHHAVALLITLGQVFGPAEIARLPPSVKIVATCSVGYDHIDLAAFKARGIWVTNTPDVLTDATADIALLLLLSACRRLNEYHAIVKNGWAKKLGLSECLGLDLRGKRLGILGMGRIGQAVARRATAFGMKILYCNRQQLSPALEQDAQYFTDFKAMLPHCDMLSLHAPGTPATHKIMGETEFSLLPANAVFINVARGSLVDEEALFKALSTQRLFAAGFDVCLNEPHPDPRFSAYPNVIMTPHMGSATRETRDAMGFRALENILMALGGETPRDNLLP